LNPAASGKNEEDDKKEEDREPSFDLRSIGSKSPDLLVNASKSLGESLGDRLVRGFTRLGILLALGNVLGNVLAAR
jgi:hypothetical protein